MATNAESKTLLLGGWSGGLWGGVEGDLMAEALELADEAAAVALGVLGVAAVEELFAELVVGGALIEDVVCRGEDLMGYGRSRRLLWRVRGGS